MPAFPRPHDIPQALLGFPRDGLVVYYSEHRFFLCFDCTPPRVLTSSEWRHFFQPRPHDHRDRYRAFLQAHPEALATNADFEAAGYLDSFPPTPGLLITRRFPCPAAGCRHSNSDKRRLSRHVSNDHHDQAVVDDVAACQMVQIGPETRGGKASRLSYVRLTSPLPREAPVHPDLPNPLAHLPATETAGIAHDDLHIDNVWQLYTGFPTHFGEGNVEVHVALYKDETCDSQRIQRARPRLPRHAELESRLVRTIDSLFGRARDLTNPEHADPDALALVHRIDPTQPQYRPLTVVQEKTWTRYGSDRPRTGPSKLI